jgi:hypothetical protein
MEDGTDEWGQEMEPDEWNGIAKLEASSEGDGDIEIDTLVDYYQRRYTDTPLWQLLEDIHRQALVWSNIVERLKAGDRVENIKRVFRDDLQLIPEGIELPNPSESRLLDRAIKKVPSIARLW